MRDSRGSGKPRSALLALSIVPGLALAQASPFLTGATALQTNILAWLTPVAIILVMVLGGMAMANRMEVFLLTKNLLTLLLAVPIHGLCMLLCARDARFFDLALLWGRTRIPALLANARLWRSSSYSSLALDLPCAGGQRRILSPRVSFNNAGVRRP